ncbi:MAG: ribosomal biogenesis protein, partial [Spirochaetales bacterium]|nr:ribosomal biogenesis protein [Candidatus Physcosoma equi]
YPQVVDIPINKEPKGIGFLLEAAMHFAWKKNKMVKVDCYELYEGIEKLADKIQSTAKKEKEIVKEI